MRNMCGKLLKKKHRSLDVCSEQVNFSGVTAVLYNAQMRSQMEYFSDILGSASKYYLQLRNSIQRRVMNLTISSNLNQDKMGFFFVDSMARLNGSV